MVCSNWRGLIYKREREPRRGSNNKRNGKIALKKKELGTFPMLSCACKKSRHIKSLRKTNPCNGAHAKRATMRGDTHIYMRASLRIGHREVTYVHYTPGWISPRVRSVLDIVIAGVLSFCRDYVQRACLSLSLSLPPRPRGRTT